MKPKFSPAGFLCVLAVGCAPQTPAPKVPDKVGEVRDYQANFACDGGERLHVRFAPYSAVLDTPDASITLTQQPAADGYLYSGEGQSLRARGADAMWTDGKGTLHHCREVPKGEAAPAGPRN